MRTKRSRRPSQERMLSNCTSTREVCNARGMPSARSSCSPQVPKKDPNHWLSHVALARIDSSKGDFAAASKEMTQALSAAPDPNKPQLQGLLKRLEAKDDINK